jgi:membrane-associated phospholipid phosphatase
LPRGMERRLQEFSPMRTRRVGLLLAVAVFLARVPGLAGASSDVSTEEAPCPAVNQQAANGPDASAQEAEAKEEHKVPSEPKLFIQDVAHVATGPLHWHKKDWLFLGGATVGLGALALVDDSATRALTSNNDHTFLDRVLNVFEPIGSVPGAGGAVAVWVYGAAFHDKKARALGFDAISADLIATAITEILKSVVGRGRPEANRGTFSFQPGRGASFPSGHTTQAFAFAAVLSSTYENPWITGVAYGAAGLVGLARIRHSAHFATDVAAGAVIGTATGLSVVHLNKRQRAEPENTPERVILSAAPSPDGRGAALVLVMHLGRM